MSGLNNIQSFIIFSLEAYKKREKKEALDAYYDFKKYKVFEFLEDGYDVLHSQSLDFVVDEIVEYIKNEDLSR